VAFHWDLIQSSKVEVIISVRHLESVYGVVNFLSDSVVLILQHCHSKCYSTSLGIEPPITLYLGMESDVVFKLESSVN
jgi:hypothetical protein